MKTNVTRAKSARNVFVATATAFVVAGCTTPTKTVDFSQAQVEREPAATLVTGNVFGEDSPLAQVNWRAAFAELVAKNIRQNSPNDAKAADLASHSMYYNDYGFQTTSQAIFNSRSSEEAFSKREQYLAVTRDKYANLLQGNTLKSLAATPNAQQLISILSAPQTPAANYFDTPHGKAVREALKDYVFLVLPGFASHTIADYTWPEIVKQANAHNGRAEVRVGLPQGDPNLHTAYLQYYSKGDNGFDVIHPMGYELGYSMGHDSDSARELAKWLTGIKSLPRFKNKRIVILGYSKGTSIAHALVATYPAVAKNVAAIITMAGVNQGAVPAESGIRKAMEATGIKSQDEFVSKVEGTVALASVVGTALAPAMMGAALGSNVPADAPVNAIAAKALQQVATAPENARVLEGIVDMSQFQRTKWNLLNMNDSKIQSKITIFNLSAVANMKDFLLPQPIANVNQPLPIPTIVPQLNPTGIDESKFSRDDGFLYATSVSGFREAPGGLFDAQVAWLDTKSMILDRRPLSDTFKPDQLRELQSELASQGLNLTGGFETVPRNRLLSDVSSGHMKNMNFVDLGEMRGTHWDLAFEEVYKSRQPASTDYHHTFPRLALQESVLELLAIYETMGGLK